METAEQHIIEGRGESCETVVGASILQTEDPGLASNKLKQRGLRPLTELASDRAHGDRLRYMAGCRCNACRRANTNYERDRVVARKAGDWNGIVPAAPARAHLAFLSSQGVGRRAVGAATSIADTVLADIIAGRQVNIRARTERLILSVTIADAADRALISAKPTWRLLNRLLRDGYSKAEIARQLGYRTPALQLNRDRVTVRNAHDVKCLYDRLRRCDAAPTLKLLNALREEGFRQPFIAQRIAREGGLKEPPSLTARDGRIPVVVAELVRRVYTLLTE